MLRCILLSPRSLQRLCLCTCILAVPRVCAARDPTPASTPFVSPVVQIGYLLARASLALNLTRVEAEVFDASCGEFDPGRPPSVRAAVVHKLKSAAAMRYTHEVLTLGRQHEPAACVPAVWNRSYAEWAERGEERRRRWCRAPRNARHARCQQRVRGGAG
mmetsp:Transcript_45389/g.141923  ORF Transcript_45389/g.141923 Transcript_45389/m.141923 type:complete len:160 (-) Transcript_45389:313-792(-)